MNSPSSPGYTKSTRLDAVNRNVPLARVEHGATIIGHNNPGSDCGTYLIIRSRSLVSSPESVTVRGVDSMPADGTEFAAVRRTSDCKRALPESRSSARNEHEHVHEHAAERRKSTDSEVRGITSDGPARSEVANDNGVARK